ncbi:unnamed protein product, partial [Mesorhabditis belari]|uniref:Uncharacterized protein n=1 Tax=Mesorhabditis belari TaxID=2138241 RepID=A0AAF3ETQ7_9BILA
MPLKKEQSNEKRPKRSVFSYANKTKEEIEEHRRELEAKIARLGGRMELHKSPNQLVTRKVKKDVAEKRSSKYMFELESSGDDETKKIKYSRDEMKGPKEENEVLHDEQSSKVDENNNNIDDMKVQGEIRIASHI